MSRSRDSVPINAPVLRCVRRLRGMDVSDLAAAMDVTASYVAKLERGERSGLSPEKYNALCVALQLADPRVLMLDPRPLAA